ncbi:uncharacterized protein SAPINGB_P004766 [Magnusiomyces paraingens]|uniref:Acyl-coenzyme A oxidase n=1 Tax=Magnusiomyces paraingens TaxID=2606893 RepID=A0A5E8BWK5_9ASCO|nr:uncharacterized protein SAPINGB_P004766 [Saprochaete ingens]VVT55843.1 unnamed protein product [Saprochaete ingens]
MLSGNKSSNVVINDKSFNTETEPPQLLKQERENVPFTVRDITHYLNGSVEQTEILEYAMQRVERDPLFNNDAFYDLTKDEIRELCFKRVANLAKYLLDSRKDGTDFRRYFDAVSVADPAAVTRLGVYTGLFMNSIEGSGTPEQIKFWYSLGANEYKRFYGCFGMTELGHGSNVAGMETEAVFDSETDEFIINTPNLAATKWWIGGAAHSATHCVCFARMIIKGKDYGMKSFVVPLRDVDSFNLLPGIAIGDIGKKMGRDGVDNGWIQFTKVRIPRQFLLMRYTKVDRSGNVTEPPLNQLAYGALVSARVNIAVESFNTARRFITIAIRYAAIRRQFASVPGQPETKILDYPLHQRRLLPRLALTYAMNAVSMELRDNYDRINNSLLNVNQNDKAALKKAVNDTKEIFALSAGVKAFTTWATADIIDECRQACGGHGYSGYNGFGQGYADWAVQCTWDGDNNVLVLSMGRALIQAACDAKRSKPVGEPFEYLSRHGQLKSSKLGSRKIDSPEVIVEAWEAAAANALISSSEIYEEELAKVKGNVAQAMEAASQQRFESARIHTRLYHVTAFFNRIKNSSSSGIKPVLTDLAILFGLWAIEKDAALFLTSGFLSAQDIKNITKLVDVYNLKIRNYAIPLTDAFNLSDYYINSPIGNYDGDVYKNYFNKVVRRNPGYDAKAPYYESVAKPFIQRSDEPKLDLSVLDE